MNKPALLLLNFQKDHFENGAYPISGAKDAAIRASSLLQCFRDHGGLHIHIQLENRKNGLDYCVPSTEGIRIHDMVAHYEGEPIVHTQLPNAFHNGDLLIELRNGDIDQLIICGLGIRVIEETIETALKMGFSVVCVTDATAGIGKTPARLVNSPELLQLTVEETITKLSQQFYSTKNNINNA